MQNSHFMVEFNGGIPANSKENKMIAHMDTKISGKRTNQLYFIMKVIWCKL